MHAYKDAVRRTAGSYILYPGPASVEFDPERDNKNYSGFHELLPGLGAFVLKPSTGSSGADQIRRFILEVLDKFISKSSQREKLEVSPRQIFQY